MLMVLLSTCASWWLKSWVGQDVFLGVVVGQWIEFSKSRGVTCPEKKAKCFPILKWTISVLWFCDFGLWLWLWLLLFFFFFFLFVIVHRLLLTERSELRASLDSSNALEVLLYLGLKDTNKAHAESHYCEDIRGVKKLLYSAGCRFVK